MFASHSQEHHCLPNHVAEKRSFVLFPGAVVPGLSYHSGCNLLRPAMAVMNRVWMPTHNKASLLCNMIGGTNVGIHIIRRHNEYTNVLHVCIVLSVCVFASCKQRSVQATYSVMVHIYVSQGVKLAWHDCTTGSMTACPTHSPCIWREGSCVNSMCCHSLECCKYSQT